ncbi:family 43 glycosylhydrolase [Luteolibacter yonseiensis]|uniref:Family 43 glycosylhydrolase n=1 Tax=Luteolibacter yonseiensis TaxID=1144680 RepID=A0A934R475_9BACT|nr:glycoside hydrolase family 43 protein [Luteolibacter yonseiensis]MBK1816599.1 family 43 glycosylhydrolase [Luteolibacter yonseiensis]
MKKFIAFGFLALSVCVFGKETKPATAIRPGEVWLDTDGKMVNAHGGGILFHAGTYYWYGEIKEGKTYLPEVNKSWGGTRVDVVGVSCYSSKDLLAWKNEGNVLPAVPGTDLDPKLVLERPKVVYNAKTKKFVLWFHSDSLNYAAAKAGVATSDSPTGPFTYHGSFRPHANQWPVGVTEEQKADEKSQLVKDFSVGQMVRDLTVFVDDDGKAYLFAASEGNPTMQISELTEDYLKTTGKYIRICEGRSMEAPAVFKREGKYHMIASGCTAWAPNAARSVVADSIWGPWKELENPCKGEKADISFFSQSTYVLPVHGKPDQFIFMGDRWIKDDLADSRYIWLPITFTEKGQPEIRWHDSWSIR